MNEITETQLRILACVREWIVEPGPCPQKETSPAPLVVLVFVQCTDVHRRSPPYTHHL